MLPHLAGNLKEDSLVNMSTHLFLICALFAFLLSWMITFAWLALRKRTEPTIPALVEETVAAQPLPLTPAPVTLHVLAPGMIHTSATTAAAPANPVSSYTI